VTRPDRALLQPPPPSPPPDVQRQDEPATAEAARRAPIRFGPYAPETYRNLYNIARTLKNELRREIEDVDEDTAERAEAEEWISGIEAWLPQIGLREDAPIDAAIGGQAQLWYEELQRIRQRVREYKRRAIERELADAERRLREVAAALRARQPQFDEQLRQAFLSQDENAIAQVSNFIGNALDIGLGVHELSRQLAQALAEAREFQIPSISRYTRMLDRLNRVLAAANLLYSMANMDAPTELGEAMNQLNVVSGAFSAGGTLLGLAPHIGLYANLYLVPLVQAITSQLGPLLDRHLHELNIVSAATGFPVEMSSEPGGWPMFFFLVAVRRAEGPEDVPWPIPEPVQAYLLEWRDQFGAGTGEAVPTTGAWFWRDVNDERIRDWVFGYRQRLWAMLYGAMPLPSEESVERARRREGGGTR